MPKKKILTMFLVLMTLVVIVAGLILNYFLFSGKSEIAGVKNLPEEVTNSIIGNYEFIQDSDGSTPNKEAEITLSLSGDGFAHLLAVQPEDRVESYGRYKIEADKIDITFYSLDKKAKEASYDFDGDNLTLPILIISDGEGSSEWKKIAVGNPIEGGQIYLEYLLSQGKGQEESAKKVMAYVKDQDDIKDVYATDDWKTITVDYDGNSNIKFLISSELNPPSILDFDLSEKEKAGASNILDKITPKANAQFLIPGTLMGSSALSSYSRKEILDMRFKSWLENEPEPIQRSDAPLTKKAVIIIPVAHYKHSKIVEDDLLNRRIIENSSLGESDTHLKKAGYEVTREGWTNDLQLKDYIRIFTTDYGVIYWNTHGTVAANGKSVSTVWLSLGNSKIWKPGDNARTVEKKFSAYIKNQFSGTKYDAFDFRSNNCLMHHNGTVYVSAKFIEKLDNDYSDGLIFLQACNSAWDMSFKKAFNAKAFVGFTKDENGTIAYMLAHDFFLNLSKKTRTAREAYDFSWGYVKHRTESFSITYSPGYEELKKKHEEAKEELKKTVNDTLDRYKLYVGSDDSPQLCAAGGDFEGLNDSVHAMLTYARKFAVGDSDRSLEGEIERLMVCYEDYWSVGKKDASKDSYCNVAHIGDPTIEDVRNAQGILGGYEDGRERFTLIE